MQGWCCAVFFSSSPVLFLTSLTPPLFLQQRCNFANLQGLRLYTVIAAQVDPADQQWADPLKRFFLMLMGTTDRSSDLSILCGQTDVLRLIFGFVHSAPDWAALTARVVGLGLELLAKSSTCPQ